MLNRALTLLLTAGLLSCNGGVVDPRAGEPDPELLEDCFAGGATTQNPAPIRSDLVKDVRGNPIPVWIEGDGWLVPRDANQEEFGAPTVRVAWVQEPMEEGWHTTIRLLDAGEDEPIWFGTPAATLEYQIVELPGGGLGFECRAVGLGL